MRSFSHRRSRARDTSTAADKTARNPRSTCTAVTTSPPAATQWSHLRLRAAYDLQRAPRLAMYYQWG